MKKIWIFLLIMVAVLSLASCGTFESSEDAYKYGYNTGVLLRGGSSSEFLK